MPAPDPSPSPPVPPSGATPPGESRLDVLLAVLACAAALGMYIATAQRGFAGDGRFLLAMIERGEWRYHHIAYLPAAHAQLLLMEGLYGANAQQALLTLSAWTAALASALVFLAARAAGIARPAAFLATSLFAAAPAVWFYATCIEVHAPHLLAASGTMLWAARARASNRLGASALPPTLWLVALIATHLTGALWALPLAFVCLRGDRGWRWPRHVLPSAGVLCVAAALWFVLRDPANKGAIFASLAAGQLFENWQWERLTRELFAPAAWLLVPAVAGVLAALRPESAESRRIRIAVALLLVPYLLLLPSFPFEERGAYGLAAYPVLAVLAAAGIRASGGVGLIAGLLLLVPQVWQGWREIDEWENEYEGVEWAEPLFAETGGRGLVLTLEPWERNAVSRHSRMSGWSLHVLTGAFDLAHPVFREQALSVIERSREEGEPIAITRSLYEDPAPKTQDYIRFLVEHFGRPRPGRHPAYLIFPADVGDASAGNDR